ncbi:hypothetical protein PC129_g9451 [Phytophthora cactorum]|uniref:Uncharacterized protein n=1 Tax=Phytophthora cactorum TaxID=29920 RepID=A0A329RVK9_9STRA|nr:hypothetical protein Pcac1_g25203 [Phytophthora cactorum]KAG2822352.1 hypothetical protein PC111_g10656 [Phytophthora cactorum]KAG2827805.1 hypothetical protein PC112_g8716 [Phytophthora cactorum]KAG2859145.1 hypothetical protein PC113_g9203 [Phytophthora cactorum]KAG2906468.1 hypothetical protein PC114_g11131 [Phytophthora cactorum]
MDFRMASLAPEIDVGDVTTSLRHLECGRTRAIDYDALEKAWEAGDEQQELRTEGDEHYRQIAEKNEDEAKALGPQMIFVTLKGEHQLLPDLASHWKEMLWNGGIEVNIYEVADSKLLVGLQKGIFVNDVMRFLDEQHEVKEYEWNGKAYSKESHRHYHKHHKTRTKKPQRKKTKGPRAKDSKFGNTTHKKRHRKPTQTLFAGKDSTEKHDEL